MMYLSIERRKPLSGVTILSTISIISSERTGREKQSIDHQNIVNSLIIEYKGRKKNFV